ncbi:MAG: DUF2270 domain-containing protein [Gemmatimonadota bacterium]|nr:DUF2270 domain-containing protein [Gemmatimonadota bacterium]
MDHSNPPQVLVHLYRAAVQHADIWRQRLDATTNWAVITTAAVITFSFGSAATPHFVVLLALLFVVFFLLMESRRYQAYNLWQRRIRVLHRAIIVPALKPADEVDHELVEVLLKKLAEDIGSWFPAIPIWAAVGYRLRRNYGPLMTLILLTWLLKLYAHPDSAPSAFEYIDRAAVGLAPGALVFVVIGVFFVACMLLALAAPSEQMKEWSLLPSPIDRIKPGTRGADGADAI